MKLHIENHLTSFLEEALPSTPEFEAITEYCPHCRMLIRYPLVARERDIKAFKLLLEIAEKYLKEHGGEKAMLEDIMGKIKAAMSREIQ